MAEIAESPIDWDVAWPAGELEVNLAPAKRHQPRPHQEQAIDAVQRGFAAGNDRGKLIMACGTGKTFTALKIAERTAADNGGAARILFLVPSISLLSQTLREWTAQCELDLRAFAVCSDTKVSRSAEDFNVHDVPIPVTTNPAVLAAEMGHRKRAKGLTVVFSTYQSLPAVAEAQQFGVDEFDLVICDFSSRGNSVRHVRQPAQMRLCRTPGRYCSRHTARVTEQRPGEGGGWPREHLSTSSRQRTTRTIRRASRYSKSRPPRSTHAVTAG